MNSRRDHGPNWHSEHLYYELGGTIKEDLAEFPISKHFVCTWRGNMESLAHFVSGGENARVEFENGR